MIETTGQRLKKTRQAAGLTQAQLAASAGVVQSAIGNIEADIRGYGRAIIEIAKTLNVSTDYLQLTTEHKNASSNVAPASIGAARIPLIDYVQAGVWTEIADTFEPGDAEDWLLTDLELSGHAFALQIKGNSMLPEFKSGDRVIIDPDVTPAPGDFVVAKNGGNEATFKKYRPRGTDDKGNVIFELVPLNDDFESLRSDNENIQVVGTMVEHRKYRKTR